MSVDKKISLTYALIELLTVPPFKRSSSEVESIFRLTSNIKFFQELTEREESSRLHLECCEVLMAQTFEKNEYICRRGEEGNAFYLVLKGSVSILSHEDVILEGSKSSRKTQELDKRSSDLVVNSEDAEKEIAILTAGQSFGEMALIHDKPRYFSVKCLEATVLGVLHKDDYQIIAKAHEKQINEKIEFIRGMEAFKNWSRLAIQKLSFFFKTQSYKKGNIVYKEGDLPTDVFIIKEGDFIFTQNFLVEAGTKNEGDGFGKLSRRRAEKVIRIKRLNVVIKQKGEIFGYNEIFDSKNEREFTCTCNSPFGELLVITDKNFAKKIIHPETLKFIEDRCSKFRNWLDPRMKQLKTTERIKDSICYTPCSRLKKKRSGLENQELRLPVLYSPSPMKVVKPNAIEKFIMCSRKASPATRNMSVNKSGLSIFPTEISETSLGKKNKKMNSSLLTRALKQSFFN